MRFQHTGTSTAAPGADKNGTMSSPPRLCQFVRLDILEAIGDVAAEFDVAWPFTEPTPPLQCALAHPPTPSDVNLGEVTSLTAAAPLLRPRSQLTRLSPLETAGRLSQQR